MRRLLWLAALLVLALTVPVGAVGTITQAHYTIGNIRKVVFTCTADAANGSFPSTAISIPIEGRLLAIETNPGSTAPTDNYDIAITDAEGLDVLQGAGQNRDTANTEMAAIVFASTSVHPAVDESDTLTLAITNNAVNSATITIVVYYALGG